MARTTGSHSQTTEPRIRAAALRLIARHGYAAVSMRQIAGEVGLQAGALYNYTLDKQSLLFDLMRAHLDELLLAWEEVDLPGNALAQLDTFTRFHIRFHSERPEAVFVAYMELRNLTPENFSRIESLRHGYEDRLEAILKAGVTTGDFAIRDTRITTRALIAMLTGINTWFRISGPLRLQEVEEIYCDMVRKAVMG